MASFDDEEPVVSTERGTELRVRSRDSITSLSDVKSPAAAIPADATDPALAHVPRNLTIIEAREGEDKSGTPFTTYLIQFELAGHESPIVVPKRFSEFDEFHVALGKKFVCLPVLPQKTIARNNSEVFVRQRQASLEDYLRKLTQRLDITLSEPFRQFLGIDTTPAASSLSAASMSFLSAIKGFDSRFHVVDARLIDDEQAAVVALAEARSSFWSIFSGSGAVSDQDLTGDAKGISKALGVLMFYRRDAAQNIFAHALSIPLSKTITCLEWDSARRWTLVGQDDGTLQIHNPSPDFSFCKRIMHAKLHSSKITEIRFNAESDSFVAISESGGVSVVDSNRQEVTFHTNWPKPTRLTAVTMDPRDSRLFVATTDSHILVYTTADEPAAAPPKPQTELEPAVEFADQKHAAQPTDGTEVSRVANSPKSGLVHQLVAHKEEILCVSYLPARRLLASGSADQQVILWKVGPSGKEPTSIVIAKIRAHPTKVVAVAIASNGDRVVSADAFGHVLVSDVHRSSPLVALRAHSEPVISLSAFPSGLLFTAGADKAVKLFQLGALVHDPSNARDAELEEVPLDAVSPARASPSQPPAASGAFFSDRDVSAAQNRVFPSSSSESGWQAQPLPSPSEAENLAVLNQLVHSRPAPDTATDAAAEPAQTAAELAATLDKSLDEVEL